MAKGKYHVIIHAFVTFIVLREERKRQKAKANGKIEIQRKETNKQIKADHTYSWQSS